MQIVKTYFGAERPNEIDYRPQADGLAEVWLYRNITADDEGYSADGIFFKTAMSEAEVLEQKETFFAKATEDPETTIADLVEAIGILTNIILEG